MVLDEIKKSTAESHERLERSGLLQPITDKTITREGYVEILKRFYGFLQPLEKKVTNIPQIQAILPDFVTRRKAEALKTDLERVEQATADVSALPICQDLPEITDASQALGYLYVMEGSTLGGQLIARLLEESLGIDQQNGAAFFYGYGPETGAKWKAFREALASYAESSGEEERIIAAANQTFLKFETWINKALPARE